MIKPKFSNDYIRKELLRVRQVLVKDVASICAYAGERFITDARSSLKIDSAAFPEGDYTDRTGNLRSSIGYIVLIEGLVTYSSDNHASDYLKGIIASLPPTKVRLIGFAYMEYASYLESMGYNVISSQANVLFVDLSKLLEKYAAGKFHWKKTQ